MTNVATTPPYAIPPDIYGQQTNYPPLPAWQISTLQDLAAKNQLNAIPPQVLAVIDWAESNGNGGGINSSGYGGYFGLGVNTVYPGGVVSDSVMRGTDPASFAQQAQVASSAFATYLAQTGGNPVTAEQIYQTGSASGPPGEGAQLMAQYLGNGTVPYNSNPGLPSAQAAQAQGAQAVTCDPVIRFPGVAGVGAVTVLDKCQAQEIVGVLLMLGGAFLMAGGVALILADLGSRSRLGTALVGAVSGGVAGKRAGTKAATNRPASAKDTGNIPDSAFGSVEGTGRSGAQEAAMNREHKDRFALLPGEEPFPD